MSFQKFSVTLFILMFLVACSNKQPTSFKVTSGFNISASSFGGGLIVYGETASGKTMSFPLEGALKKEVPLDQDTWDFYVVGWSLAGFKGDTFCGNITANNKEKSTIEIEISKANCSSAKISALKIKPTKVVFCQSFRHLNPSTNQWSAITSTTDDSACVTSTNAGYQQELSYYRIIASDKSEKNPGSSLTSACYKADGLMVNSVNVPYAKIPLQVRGYKSLEDCDNKSEISQLYDFHKGLSQNSYSGEGSIKDFQHLYFEYEEFAKVIVASSVSRRGYSIFQNLIPNITCGDAGLPQSECIPEISNPIQMDVPWKMTSTDKPRFLEESTSSCSSLAPAISEQKYFSFKNSDCFAHDGKLFVNLKRNEILCQKADEFGQVIDLKKLNSKLYMLVKNGSLYFLKIYNDAGALISEMQVTSGASLTSMDVVVVLGDIKIFIADGNEIKRLTYNESLNSFTTEGSYFAESGETIQEVAADSNGAVIFSTTNLKINSIGPSGVRGTASNTMATASRIIIIGTKVYYILGAAIYSATWNGSSLTAVDNAVNLTGVADIFTDGIYFYTLATTGRIEKRNLTMPNTLMSSSGIIPQTRATNSRILVDGVNANFTAATGLYSYANIYSSLVPLNSGDGSCTDTILVGERTFTAGSSYKSTYNLLNHASQIVGRNFLTNQHQFMLFDSLNEDGKPSTGGKLRKVQEHLSNQGVASLLSDKWGSCAQLKTAATAATQSVLAYVKDPEEDKIMKISATVKRSNTDVPPYFCESTNPLSSTCTGKYDLDIEFQIGDTDHTERMLLKLSCDSKRGSLESYELSEGKVSREFITWNTESSINSRFETFHYYSNGVEQFGEYSFLLRKGNNSDLNSRHMEVHSNGTTMNGSFSELQSKGSILSYESFGVSEPTEADFVTNSDAMRTSLSGYNNCLNLNTNPSQQLGTYYEGPLCNISSGFTSTSRLTNATAASMPTSLVGLQDGSYLFKELKKFFYLTVPSP